MDVRSVLVLDIACVAVIGFALVLGHKLRWSRALRVTLGIAGALAAAIPLLLFAWLAGWLNPIFAYAAQSKVDVLERHLYVGERRTDIEKELGRAIPKPDRRDGYGLSGEDVQAGMAGRTRGYFYDAESAFCIQSYRGIVVYFDSRDRVKRWVHTGFGTGC
ncbi:MAG: hypothetical protein QOD51_1614 [Candidatus Eremiobacteraeota bacterium]|jgi:hypothetical protein|nr:hypothetical protein [Candidatus Eremiobacteraeota bacterium]